MLHALITASQLVNKLCFLLNFSHALNADATKKNEGYFETETKLKFTVKV